MFHRRIDFATLAATLLLLLFSSSGVAEEPAEEMSLSDLQAERLKVLKEAVDQTKKMYQSARIPFHELWEAQRMLYEAELEQSDSKEDRIATLEEYLNLAKTNEEISVKMREVARGTSRDVLQAKAERLRIQIMLVKAKTGNGDTASMELHKQLALARHHLAIKLSEVKMAEAKLKIASATRTTIKSHVDEAVAMQAIKEEEAKNAEKLVKQSVVSPQEARIHREQLIAAESRRIAAEFKVAESEAQVMFEEACVQHAQLEAEMAQVEINLLQNQLEGRN